MGLRHCYRYSLSLLQIGRSVWWGDTFIHSVLFCPDESVSWLIVLASIRDGGRIGICSWRIAWGTETIGRLLCIVGEEKGD